MTLDRSGEEASALREYLRLLRRGKWTVILTVVVAVALMAAYIVHKTPIYQATAQLELTPQVSSAVLQANNASINSAASLVDVPTEIQVIESQSVADRVARTVPGAPPVSVSQVGTTNVVNLAVRSPDRVLAASAANAYATEFIASQADASSSALSNAIQVLQARTATLQHAVQSIETQLSKAVGGPQAQSLQSQLSSLEQTQTVLREEMTVYETAAALTTGGGQVVTAARIPGTPVVPKPAEYLVLALILGLAGGIGLAFLREQLDDKVRFLDDVERALGPVPALGTVPPIARKHAGGMLVARDDTHSPAAEAYRVLRTAIEFVRVGHSIKLVQITSPGPGDGKTTTLANLGVILAQAGHRVIAIDCDLRRPWLHTLFDVPNAIGFTSVLLGEVAPTDALLPARDIPGLRVLPSGPVPPFPSELLSTSSSTELLRTLADDCDVVLIDSPPVLPVADAAVLAGQVDAVILVGSAGYSTRRDVSVAVSRLEKVHAPLRGFILNRAVDRSGAYDRYGYYGAYAADDQPQRSQPSHGDSAWESTVQAASSSGRTGDRAV